MAAVMAKIEAQEMAEMAEMAAKDAHGVDYVDPEEVTDASGAYAPYFEIGPLRALLTFDRERGGIPARLIRARWMLECP